MHLTHARVSGRMEAVRVELGGLISTCYLVTAPDLRLGRVLVAAVVLDVNPLYNTSSQMEIRSQRESLAESGGDYGAGGSPLGNQSLVRVQLWGPSCRRCWRSDGVQGCDCAPQWRKKRHKGWRDVYKGVYAKGRCLRENVSPPEATGVSGEGCGWVDLKTAPGKLGER